MRAESNWLSRHSRCWSTEILWFGWVGTNGPWWSKTAVSCRELQKHIHRGDGSWWHQGPYYGHQAKKSWNQVLKLFWADRGDSHIKGWDSDNLRKATFAVWIHTDSPINSALLERLLCLPLHAMAPTSKGRQPWASKGTSRRQLHCQALWAQVPFSLAPGPQEKHSTLDLGIRGS